MYSRKAVLTSKDPSDHGRLRRFAHEISTHNMYQPIIDQLKQIPGFVSKEHIMIDNLQGETFISQICFENQETFENYINDESISSLWDYLSIVAEQAGIDVSITDQAIN